MSAADLSVLQRPNDKRRKRRFVNRGMEVVAWVAAAIAVGLLGLLVWSVAKQGASQLNLDLITKPPSQNEFALNPGPQGLANAFVGTFIIVAIATAIALPIGILVAIYVNEFAPRAVKNFLTPSLDILNGIPAIVVGHGQSGFAGGFALSVLMIPLVARATIEVLALVPDSLREASLGLGVPRWRTTLGIVLPQTVGGIITGGILAMSRIAGEAAPLFFLSAIGANVIDWNPLHPLSSVPWAIFQGTDSPYDWDKAHAWAGALVIMVFILIVSVGARLFAARSRRKIASL